jgi:hypothetical protein
LSRQSRYAPRSIAVRGTPHVLIRIKLHGEAAPYTLGPAGKGLADEMDTLAVGARGRDNGQALDHIRFSSEAACERAPPKFVEQSGDANIGVVAFCVQDDG